MPATASAAKSKRWRQRHPDAVRAQKRRAYKRVRTRPAEVAQIRQRNLAAAQALRSALVAAMGGRCVRCGFSDIRALQVDHVNGHGRRELATVTSRNAYYKTVLAHPERYQLLCANCNWIKRAENAEHRWRDVAVGVTPRLTTASAVTED